MHLHCNSIGAVALLVSMAVSTQAQEGREAQRLQWQPAVAVPDARGVAGPFVGVAGGQLLVAGGANFPNGWPWDGGEKVWYDRVWGLQRPEGVWREVGRLPTRAGYGVSITTESGLICIGGSHAGGHLADVYRLQLAESGLTAQPLPSLPAPLANACGAMVGTTIYVAGGSRTPTATSALNTFYALDLSGEPMRWRQLESWPGPARMLSVAAVVDDHFYLISGVALTADAAGKPQRRYLTDAYRYHAEHGWGQLADVPRSVAAAPSPALPVGKSRFLVLGGDDGSAAGFQPIDQHPGFSRRIYSYDTTTDVWTEVGATPAPHVTTTIVPWGDDWWLPSGEVRPGVRSPDAWRVHTDP